MSTRRFCLLAWVGACAMLVLAGCSDASRSSVDSFRLLVRGQPKVSPTAQQVAAKPYYQMQATTADGDAVLVLGNVDGERELWYGKDGVVVVLQHGRVVQTMGLKQNLDGSRLSPSTDPFALGLQTLQSPLTYQRVDDWSPGYRYGIPVRAELTATGNADIDILGTHHRVIVVSESVAAETAAYRATNRYWVDPGDGFVWKSEQHVMPGLTLTLVQLRPYRGAKP